MGQKTVRFSDLSGELITRDDTLARIVIHEHPELGDSPVEIEALADEAAAIDKAALRVTVVDLYFPGEDEPRRVTMEAAAAKYFASEMVGRVADRAVQIFGGAGYVADHGIERLYRDVRIFRIYEGTSQIQQVVIARETLKRGG